MKIKDFFQKKYLIFYFAITSFILLMISTLVIGVETVNPQIIITLSSLAKDIQNLNQIGIDPPPILLTTYSLLVTGLIFSGTALVFLFVNLLSIKKISKYQNWFWWIGIALVLLSFILIISGESYYVNETLKIIDASLKFTDFWVLSRFVGLVLCITVWPLTLITLGIIWWPKFIKVSPTAK